MSSFRQFKVFCDLHPKEPVVKASFNKSIERQVFCNECLKTLSKSQLKDTMTIKEFTSKITEELKVCFSDPVLQMEIPKNLTEIVKNQNTIKKKLSTHIEQQKIYVEKIFSKLKEEICKMLDENKMKINSSLDFEYMTLSNNIEDFDAKLMVSFNQPIKPKEEKNYFLEPENWIYGSHNATKLIENTKRAIWFYNNVLAYHEVIKNSPTSVIDLLNNLHSQLEKSAKKVPMFSLQFQKDSPVFISEVVNRIKSDLNEALKIEENLNAIELKKPLEYIPTLNPLEMSWLSSEVLKSNNLRFLEQSSDFGGEITKLIRSMHDCGRILLVMKTFDGEKLFYYTDKNTSTSASYKKKLVVSDISFFKSMKDSNFDKYYEAIGLGGITLVRNYKNGKNHYLFGSEYRQFVLEDLEIYQVLGDVNLEGIPKNDELNLFSDTESILAEKTKTAFHKRQLSTNSTISRNMPKF